MNLGVRAVAASRTDDESFEALFRAEYARVAGIANRVRQGLRHGHSYAD